MRHLCFEVTSVDACGAAWTDGSGLGLEPAVVLMAFFTPTDTLLNLSPTGAELSPTHQVLKVQHRRWKQRRHPWREPHCQEGPDREGCCAERPGAAGAAGTQQRLVRYGTLLAAL